MDKVNIILPLHIEYDEEIDKLLSKPVDEDVKGRKYSYEERKKFFEQFGINIDIYENNVECTDEEVKEFMEHFGIEYVDKKD